MSQTPVTRYHLKVTLKDAHVKIEREFVVPADINLQDLSQVIQFVMGWDGGHLHSFTINKEVYEIPFEDDFADSFTFSIPGIKPIPRPLDESKFLLNELVVPGIKTFSYLYDFGDSWEHRILVRSYDYQKEPDRYVFCLKGTGACPPEDCGGVLGYEAMCQTVAKGKGRAYREMCDWLGRKDFPEGWETAFDLDEANMRLATADQLLRPRKLAKVPAKKAVKKVAKKKTE